ncbi:TRADD-N-associated membrane domain-containing protein [Streptomyces griseosporeus]|uniref:TRADD-N-associated membrane domain-containing protein n=1 Tax=Streptomyces griseosporeus TaxID=1910 RepID=UPI0036F65464
MLLLTTGTAAYSSLSSLIPELSPVAWGVIGAFAAAATAGFVLAVLRLQRREAQEIEAGRERVRSAERNLEAALRSERSPGASSIAVSGDLILLPHPSGAEDSEGANPPPAELNGGLEGRPAHSESPSRETEAGTPASPPRLTLPELWTVTHTRLDLYHDIATGQARRSFRNAQAAMITGFVLLIVFVVVALQASTTAGSVVAGGLGAVSAALSGFVARTFVKSQETAAAHLRAYFDQPLEFSRYLAAERLIADSALTEQQRAEALTALIQAMVAPPAAPIASGQAPGEQGQADQQ